MLYEKIFINYLFYSLLQIYFFSYFFHFLWWYWLWRTVNVNAEIISSSTPEQEKIKIPGNKFTCMCVVMDHT